MRNPLIWADVPDTDVIRVGNYFYMSSTSMHMMPGIPIMRSIDLVNREIVAYVYDILENNDAHNLINGQNIYGKGSWANSPRYHNNTFYICFSSIDIFQARNTLTQKTQGPTCSGEAAIQTENIKPGDYAGIAAFQNTCGLLV